MFGLQQQSLTVKAAGLDQSSARVSMIVPGYASADIKPRYKGKDIFHIASNGSKVRLIVSVTMEEAFRLVSNTLKPKNAPDAATFYITADPEENAETIQSTLKTLSEQAGLNPDIHDIPYHFTLTAL